MRCSARTRSCCRSRTAWDRSRRPPPRSAGKDRGRRCRRIRRLDRGARTCPPPRAGARAPRRARRTSDAASRADRGNVARGRLHGGHVRRHRPARMGEVDLQRRLQRPVRGARRDDRRGARTSTHGRCRKRAPSRPTTSLCRRDRARLRRSRRLRGILRKGDRGREAVSRSTSVRVVRARSTQSTAQSRHARRSTASTRRAMRRSLRSSARSRRATLTRRRGPDERTRSRSVLRHPGTRAGRRGRCPGTRGS